MHPEERTTHSSATALRSLRRCAGRSWELRSSAGPVVTGDADLLASPSSLSETRTPRGTAAAAAGSTARGVSGSQMRNHRTYTNHDLCVCVCV